MDAIFEAVLRDEKEVARLLESTPGFCRARISEGRLVEEIPHWSYVGDTVLHLAAAGPAFAVWERRHTIEGR